MSRFVDIDTVTTETIDLLDEAMTQVTDSHLVHGEVRRFYHDMPVWMVSLPIKPGINTVVQLSLLLDRGIEYVEASARIQIITDGVMYLPLEIATRNWPRVDLHADTLRRTVAELETDAWKHRPIEGVPRRAVPLSPHLPEHIRAGTSAARFPSEA